MTSDEHPEPKGDPGTCGFCGIGGGYLGEQGDESTEYLHSSVKNEDRTYSPHPNAHGSHGQYITWCGRCVGGLAHKYQRYDDTNLRAKLAAAKVRESMDGLRFPLGWNEEIGKDVRDEFADDPGTHLEKLRVYDEIPQMAAEIRRRHGFDITTESGWRS